MVEVERDGGLSQRAAGITFGKNLLVSAADAAERLMSSYKDVSYELFLSRTIFGILDHRIGGLHVTRLRNAQGIRRRRRWSLQTYRIAVFSNDQTKLAEALGYFADRG